MLQHRNSGGRRHGDEQLLPRGGINPGSNAKYCSIGDTHAIVKSNADTNSNPDAVGHANADADSNPNASASGPSG